MQVTIYAVNPGGRDWKEWLDRPVDERTVSDIDPKAFKQPDWYAKSGRFLVLIHFGDLLEARDHESAAALERNWQDLPGEVRERVWWFVYSGSGYWDLVSAQPNVHYFRNLVSREWLSDDEKRHFRQFVTVLESDEQLGSTIWANLYPTDNVAAATLLALLTSSEWTEIQPAIKHLLDEKKTESLARAHRQFAARVKLKPNTPPPTLTSWVVELTHGNYSAVRDQLIDALGAVPD